MIGTRRPGNTAALAGTVLAMTLPLLALAACGDDCCQKVVDNFSPLSSKPLPTFTISVEVSPQAADQLKKHNSRVLVSVLPVKIADKGETPDWWSYITMGPTLDALVDGSGEVRFSGMKVKERFLANDGYNKIIANVNVYPKPYVSDVECDMFDAPVKELQEHHRAIECTLKGERPFRRAQAEARRPADAHSAHPSR